MKKEILLFVLITFLIPCSIFPQFLGDYISEIKGDTLVVKDYYEMNNQPNSLFYALLLDTVNVPKGRVYELKANGFYPLTKISVTSSNHPTVIVGSDPEIVVNNKDINSAPPVICRGIMESGTGIDHCIDANGDLTIKNCALIPASNDGSLGSLFTGTLSSNLHLVYDNCIMEHTAGAFVAAKDSDCAVIFRNCYFVNMSGYPCRQNGGVFDCFAPQDTLLVENCTHIMAQGSLYKFKAYPFKRIIINHNTFLNCAGNVFLDLGYQKRISMVSNIFINCNLQFCTADHSIDLGEHDPDWQPIGIVNVYPDQASTGVINTYNAPSTSDVKAYYVDRNLVYWDPLTDDMRKTLEENKVDGITQWLTQMIVMNWRSEEMFNNKTAYPLLMQGSWYQSRIPAFTDSKDLFTDQLLNLKTFALATVDTGALGRTAVLPDWRLVSTSPESFVHPDWPITVDLSYNDAELLTSGLGGFPIGDLNWFPAQKLAWLAQRNAEYTYLEDLNSLPIIGIKEIRSNIPGEFILNQNFPNPFNPSTNISFSIPKAGYVILKLYNGLGEEIITLVDGFKTPQTYNIKFDGNGLASGVYFYQLRVNGFSVVKKMLLIR